MEKNFNESLAEHRTEYGKYTNVLIHILLDMVKNHDKTKITNKEEHDAYEDMYNIAEKCGKDSVEYKELRENYASIIEGHNKTNRHHPEFFTGKENEMNLFDLMEILIDWKLDCDEDGEDVHNFITNKMQKEYHMSDDIINLFITTSDLIDSKKGRN